MPRRTPKYDYSSLVKKLVRELHKNQNGMSAIQIVNRLGLTKPSTTWHSPFVRSLVRKANALLVDHGYSIQWSPKHRAYLLAKNGVILEDSIRHKKRHVTTRLNTIKDDILSVRNAHKEGTAEWKLAENAMLAVDFAVNVIKSL